MYVDGRGVCMTINCINAAERREASVSNRQVSTVDEMRSSAYGS